MVWLELANFEAIANPIFIGYHAIVVHMEQLDIDGRSSFGFCTNSMQLNYKT